MRRQPLGPLREQRLRDEPLDPRLPELRLTPIAPPTSCAPGPRAPGLRSFPPRHLRARLDPHLANPTRLTSQALPGAAGA